MHQPLCPSQSFNVAFYPHYSICNLTSKLFLLFESLAPHLTAVNHPYQSIGHCVSWIESCFACITLVLICRINVKSVPKHFRTSTFFIKYLKKQTSHRSKMLNIISAMQIIQLNLIKREVSSLK